jgi:hypothetical protein
MLIAGVPFAVLLAFPEKIFNASGLQATVFVVR